MNCIGACSICAVHMGKGFAKANALDAVIDCYRFIHTGRAGSARRYLRSSRRCCPLLKFPPISHRSIGIGMHIVVKHADTYPSALCFRATARCLQLGNRAEPT